jgi:hypothetical protein
MAEREGSELPILSIFSVPYKSILSSPEDSPIRRAKPV